jgi:hypothetical protein
MALGGFASSILAGLNRRRYHGLLVAAMLNGEKHHRRRVRTAGRPLPTRSPPLLAIRDSDATAHENGAIDTALPE